MDTGANWLNGVASTSRRQCVVDARRRSADKRRVGAAIDRRATMIGGTNKGSEQEKTGQRDADRDETR